MSSQNDTKDTKKDSSPKLSLRRETVRNLSVRTGMKSGMPAECTESTEFSCNGSGPCTRSGGPTVG